MLSGVWIIFRKELVDTLRDRKTLVFMLLMPTLAIPLLMWGLTRLIQGIEKKQAVQVVKIAADQSTHQTYRRLIHRWFLHTEVARGLRLASSPVVQALLDTEAPGAAVEIPKGLFSDPAVFEQWARDTVSRVRRGFDPELEELGEQLPDLPEELRDQLADYYQVTVKGLGLVQFVDPSTLGPPPPDFDPQAIPEDLRSIAHADEIAAAIGSRSIQGYLEIPPAAEEELDGEHESTVEVLFLHDSTIGQSEEARKRISLVIDQVGAGVVAERLKARGLGEQFLNPLELREDADLASQTQVILSKAGGMLPYVVILFAFLGGFYPAIDLGAGEKERNTLETLILSPAGRTQIALGKFGVILTASLIAALLGVLSIGLSIKHVVLPESLLKQFDLQIGPGVMVLVALLSVPPAAAFAGMFLAISIYARSFKEAQNYIAPLQFVVILPAMSAMVPGLEMNWKMALIPLVNVSLLSKDFLKGDINWGFYALTVASCLLLAAACIAFGIRQFRREEVLFRS
jgi:sodium transport system permease protein